MGNRITDDTEHASQNQVGYNHTEKRNQHKNKIRYVQYVT